MKTRVIQDDPDRPTIHDHPAEPAETTRPNLAARMARWSAHRRSTSGAL
jgi:hypothetical protein